MVLRVAVHDAPFEGLPAASHILGAVLDGILRNIEVVETIPGDDTAVLMCSAQVAAHQGRAEGLLVLRPNASGRFAQLTVFLRPLAACRHSPTKWAGRMRRGRMAEGDGIRRWILSPHSVVAVASCRLVAAWSHR